ncbi:DDB1-and CUL4-associated factor 4-like protein 1 [Trichonephila inaurata madagascariensis]|uniref:DDB1-and CUL4-associated factor 4-like protein 1 n=1 Tax=Trichonephila inaurata madagascariensis TaxID=2747483 RepID=A0A8X6WV65_9ARAC|nr:DDB1-and CUL4-associated factor 4-like protein 1 [Trichonephila inaurata madagascariensis]
MAKNPSYHFGKGGILNNIALRELGMIRNSTFHEKITKIRIDQLPELGIHTTSKDVWVYRQSYRTGPEGCIIGLRQYRKPHCETMHSTGILAVNLEYNMESTVRPKSNTPLPLISTFKIEAILPKNISVTDSCDLLYDGRTPILYVGNYNNGESAVGLTFFNCEGSDNDLEWKVGSHTFCCSSNIHSGRFAIGCKGSIYLGVVDFTRRKKYNIPGNVLALDFNNDGNLIFTGSDEQGIEVIDIRDFTKEIPLHIRKSSSGKSSSARKKDPLFRESLIVNKMKLLSDQVTLITTDIEGVMRKLDLRMRRSVLTYSEHVGFEYPRTLCLDESLDLLCAAGKDNYIRIWSLSSGHLHWADKIESPVQPAEETVTHCCIISSQRRWFISVIENDKLIPLVPAPDYLYV